MNCDDKRDFGLIGGILAALALLLYGAYQYDELRERKAFKNGRECAALGVSVVANPHTGSFGESWLRGWMEGVERAE